MSSMHHWFYRFAGHGRLGSEQGIAVYNFVFNFKHGTFLIGTQRH